MTDETHSSWKFRDFNQCFGNCNNGILYQLQENTVGIILEKYGFQQPTVVHQVQW